MAIESWVGPYFLTNARQSAEAFEYLTSDWLETAAVIDYGSCSRNDDT